MSAEPEREMTFVRHPLGLPPGSVRAFLALMIAGLFWLLMALPDSYPEDAHVPLFLYVLLGLIMLFFSSHGNTIGHHITGQSPLYLPRGLLRGFLIVGTAAELVWLYHSYPERLTGRLTPDPKQLEYWPALLMSAFGGLCWATCCAKARGGHRPASKTCWRLSLCWQCWGWSRKLF